MNKRKMNKRHLQRLILFFLILFSIVYCAASIRLKIGRLVEPGPGFMPFIIGVFMGTVSLIELRRNFKAQIENGEMPFSPKKVRKPLMVCAAVAVYALILTPLGYLSSTFLLMLFLLKGIEPQRWITAIIVATFATAISYLIFVVWLGSQFV